MTLFSLEGPSRAGKTTVQEILTERHPGWVSFSGMSIPERSTDGKEEWRREMQFYRPVYEQNPENIFLVNRQFSELAYAHDEETRKYVKRTLAMWKDAHILWFYADDETLENRNSPDRSTVIKDYMRPALEAFPVHEFNTTVVEPEETADAVEQAIFEVRA